MADRPGLAAAGGKVGAGKLSPPDGGDGGYADR